MGEKEGLVVFFINHRVSGCLKHWLVVLGGGVGRGGVGEG